MSKGSNQRPREISVKLYNLRYELAFCNDDLAKVLILKQIKEITKGK